MRDARTGCAGFATLPVSAMWAGAMVEAGCAHKVVFVGHGLSPDTRALLIRGSMDAVITQSPQTAMTSCVRIFTNVRDGLEPMGGVEVARSQAIFRENLP